MEDSPNPDAEETDVFLVRGSERRARKEKEADPLPDKGTSVFEPEKETTPATPASVTPPVAPSGSEADSVSGFLVPTPEASAAPPNAGESTVSVGESPRGQMGPVNGPGPHAPAPDGYEQRITAVKAVPASPWRRAVFTVTGGRLNLG